MPLTAGNVVIGASMEAAQEWERLLSAYLNNGNAQPPGGVVKVPAAAAAAIWGEGSKGTEQQQQHHGDLEGTAMEMSVAAMATVKLETSEPFAEEGEVAPTSSYQQQLQHDEQQQELGRRPVLASEWVHLASRQLVGVYLTVWVRHALLPAVRGVQALSVGTGILGLMGNKGAVAVRLRLHDSSLCIINSHLSSGEGPDSLQRRLYDYGEVVRRGYFPAEDEAPALSPLWPCDAAGSLMAEASSGPAAAVMADAAGGLVPSLGQWGSELHILDSEMLVWMGDMNFRQDVITDKMVSGSL